MRPTVSDLLDKLEKLGVALSDAMDGASGEKSFS